MADTNIVILGGNYAGVNTAHYLLKFVLPTLPGNRYKVLLVNPSKDFYHNISAPRSLVSTDLLPESKTFFDIAGGFKQYGDKNFVFVHGKANSVDPSNRSVAVQLNSGEKQVIPFHALIIATGARSQDPVLSFQGDDGQQTRTALVEIRQKLAKAKSVVVGGGGPAGVEAAGEIAEHFNGKPGWFSKPRRNVQVQLFTGADKLLPILRPAIAKRAEDMLREMGVETTCNTKITGTEQLPSGKTKVNLSTGKSIETDVYINAIGTKPSTEFLPREWLNDREQVNNNSNTLRVDVAGPRVYAVGDVGAHSRGGMMELFEAVPVLATNLKTDILSAAGTKPTSSDRTFKANTSESQGVTIGQSRAIGAFNGMKVPGIMIWAIKGRDYMYSAAKAQVEGAHWKKEVAYKALPIKVQG
ncbi:FAD/NAD(P)-binding domain-containing protein [Myriangium duriaei CBS 260.36]|uniref:FAD/NAD(P)-binding domain-containing protein n=1 Tax=Myriangium duriaei CBS 260.36 TaxID=1168546 RepID=A0A9P4IT30_9PEZI|nr:FAD/NAD(P)-binding domain-containing protein [Myriangium duriaei CBS 260.36]